MNVNFIKFGLFTVALSSAAVYGMNTPVCIFNEDDISSGHSEKTAKIAYKYEGQIFDLGSKEVKIDLSGDMDFKDQNINEIDAVRQRFWTKIAGDIAKSIKGSTSLEEKNKFIEEAIAKIDLETVLVRNFLKNILEYAQVQIISSHEVSEEEKFETRTLLQSLQIEGGNVKINKEWVNNEKFGTLLLKGIKTAILEAVQNVDQDQKIDISKVSSLDFDVDVAVKAIFSCNDVTKIEPESVDSFKEAVLLELETLLP